MADQRGPAHPPQKNAFIIWSRLGSMCVLPYTTSRVELDFPASDAEALVPFPHLTLLSSPPRPIVHFASLSLCLTIAMLHNVSKTNCVDTPGWNKMSTEKRDCEKYSAISSYMALLEDFILRGVVVGRVSGQPSNLGEGCGGRYWTSPLSRTVYYEHSWCSKMFKMAWLV